VIDLERLLAWLRALASVFAEHKSELTDLDAAIGDADHGINMDRGFGAVVADLQSNPPADIAAALKNTAMTLMRTVGGAAGPLYGTFFLRASTACAGLADLSPEAWAAAFSQGVAGVRQRGKAEPGDKTMIDALVPAAAALQEALQEGCTLAETLRRAERAAEKGMAGTIVLAARKGRASYLGERSIGHQDPGATSAWLLVRTAADVLAGTLAGEPA
jgi:dihydroxyacetone kinase-like protein